MDTYITISAYGAEEKDFHDMTELITDLESKLSRTKENSDISKLNNAGTNKVEISDETAELLKTALDYCDRSGGVFDITVAPLTDLWNVTSENPKVPSMQKITDALLNINYKFLKADGNTAYFECENMKCDLGGIAKGYTADKAANLFKNIGISSALIQVGSSVYVLGTKPDGKEYVFGIRNPEGTPNDYLGEMSVKDKYITSSGDYERYFEEDGKRYCHIFDTMTGYPVDNDLRSVVVITDSGTYGDYISTLLFCMGLNTGLEKCKSENIDAIFITKDKKVYLTDNLKNKFTLTCEDYSYGN